MSKLNASIIIPIYNSEKYLEKCLDSLLDQTVDDYEIILIDDGSKDNSGNICDLYKSKSEKIKVIHQENSGVSCARNAGLEIACGKYILFCDSDDYVENDFVETFVSGFEETDCDLLVVRMQIISDNNVTYSNANEKRIIDKKKFLYIWKWGLFGEMCSKGFKRSIIADNKLNFNREMSYGEDFCFITKYLRYINNDILILPNPVYCYIIREGSLISRYHNNLFKDVYLKMFNEIEKNIDQFQITERNILTDFYTGYFVRFIKCILNIFDGRNTDGIIKKIKQARKVLISDEFEKCYKNADRTNIVKSLLFVCKFKSVILILLYILLTKKFFTINKKIIY